MSDYVSDQLVARAMADHADAKEGDGINVSAAELERLRKVEKAAREWLEKQDATPMLRDPSND